MGLTVPAADASWQLQLSSPVDTSVDVSFYIVDGSAEPTLPQVLKAAGRTVACYVSAGTFEPWRDDADQFPARVIGRPLDDYPNERWLDVRDASVRSLMSARLEKAARQGCDSLQASSLEGYLADSGFELTLADDLDYARFLSAESHQRGLSLGLSASGELVALAEPSCDWGLAEECLLDADCDAWSAFRAAAKPVFMVEFGTADDAASLCPQAARLNFNLLIKRRALDAFRVACDSP
jgi:hypothetical protein